MGRFCGQRSGRPHPFLGARAWLWGVCDGGARPSRVGLGSLCGGEVGWGRSLQGQRDGAGATRSQSQGWNASCSHPCWARCWGSRMKTAVLVGGGWGVEPTRPRARAGQGQALCQRQPRLAAGPWPQGARVLTESRACLTWAGRSKRGTRAQTQGVLGQICVSQRCWETGRGRGGTTGSGSGGTLRGGRQGGLPAVSLTDAGRCFSACPCRPLWCGR